MDLAWDTPLWTYLALLPFLLQGFAMTVDEFFFHRRRGLGRWERLGHPLDSFFMLVPLAWALATDFNPRNLVIFILLGAFSCLLVTKDEPVHTAACSSGENWLHAVLFVLHPLTLAGAAWLWRLRDLDHTHATLILGVEAGVVTLFMIYQIAYWILLPAGRQAGKA